VPKNSATLGLAGKRENQVGLDANHSDMCCFDSSVQHDNDLYEFVDLNVRQIYKSAVAAREKGKWLENAQPEPQLEERMASLRA
jgi:hypothetical protein